MKIPNKFAEILHQSHSLNSFVHSAIATITPWVEDNKVVFFPEYTDHGPTHIQQVLDSAEALISNDSWPILGAEDITVLVNAILFHDCAMHLSEEGFISLVEMEDEGDRDFGDRSWRQLWLDFLAEAKRFDDRRLKRLFGDTEPVRPPALDSLEMTKRDRLLIGEFLRRHHPRLAHEIAMTGIPGPQEERLQFSAMPHDMRRLCGIVARSHGTPLRDTIDYLNKIGKWGARRTKAVHVTYLMTLVRIADYLQIHRDRAPGKLLMVRALRSPVSRGEWEAHDAIKDIHQETDDSEAIWVEAEPQNVTTFLKIRKLLNDIQREIDDCWAVLGEVYSSKKNLQPFGLTIRRIRSNLDDEKTYARSVTFVPLQAALDTSGAELLKLLIKPLYGQKPEFGVRELLQNAVDACRELKDFLSQQTSTGALELTNQQADVVIRLSEENGAHWIEVSDRGIGMTLKTVLDYFLKAGASFRNSDQWRRQHEDTAGRPRVLRSGRFGIGVLAGFLLGDEIHVSTRHAGAGRDDGISFSCRLENELVELRRENRPVGTTIRIKLSRGVYSSLVGGDKWDWYCLDEPTVDRVSEPGSHRLGQKYHLPSNSGSLPFKWRKFNFAGFDEIHWSHLERAPDLACNGIVIPQSKDEVNSESWNTFQRPSLSVFDSIGSLPLNLQRTGLTANSLEFVNELVAEIERDFLAFLLVNTPTKPPTDSSVKADYHSLDYPGLRSKLPIGCLIEGLTLTSPWHLREMSISKLLHVPINVASQLTHMVKRSASTCIVPVLESRDYGESENSFENVLPYHSFRYDRRGYPVQRSWVEASRFVGLREDVEELRNRLNKANRIPFDDDDDDDNDNRELQSRHETDRELFRGLEIETLTKFWCVLCDETNRPEDPELVNIFELPKMGRGGFLVSYLNWDLPIPDDVIATLWQRILRVPYIPYDLKKRRTLLSHAYEELATYIAAWEEGKKLGCPSPDYSRRFDHSARVW